MCGICGYLDPGGQTTLEQLEQNANSMANAISHRGPDDSGVWTNKKHGIALGFRRLAILDLSYNGHQPMMSSEQRYIIVFNGEIYNYQSLRSDLEERGYRFNGQSDTEVMLAAFTEWGIEKAVTQFNGMFAIALWDDQDKQLFLIRDRIGVKPLYYGWNGGCFFFASELKALLAHPKFHGQLDETSMGQYFRYGYVPTPRSIYRGIGKLNPGSILAIKSNKPGDPGQIRRYWELDSTVVSKSSEHDEETLLEELELLLRDSVRLRMVADVPLGAFLSGGVDSSTIVALMQSQSSRPVKTFTIGFKEAGYDEASYAKSIAAHLGTEHTEFYVTPQEAMDVIPRLPKIYDEPFADSSQIPTFLVSKLTRQEVTVSLSGDGGDEFFYGYNRYRWAQKIWNSIGWLPQSGRAWFSRLLTTVPISRWDNSYDVAARFFPRRMRVPQIGDKIQKLAAVLAKGTPEAVYEQLVTCWQNPAELAVSSNGNELVRSSLGSVTKGQSFGEWMSRADIQTYLPDDILVKLDRASMAVSLEARVPLIDDHRIVEFTSRLPMSMKYRNGQSKWLLRKLLYKYVPKGLVERPKMGFGVPIHAWLRGPLRQWAEALIDPHELDKQGILRSELVQKKWEEHLSGSRNWQSQLWNILMFQAWLGSV